MFEQRIVGNLLLVEYCILKKRFELFKKRKKDLHIN